MEYPAPEKDETADATREAHRLKGTTALVGARDVRAAAEVVEATARAKDLDTARAVVRTLSSALDTLALWIAA